MSNLPLNIENLKKTYQSPPSAWAVNDVTFTVNPGEVFGLLGPNGAGKTTIISTITTLEHQTSGSVKVFGFEVADQPREAKKMLGVVHQEVITSGFFDVEEILRFQSGYYGFKRNKERIDFLLHKLALWDHRHKKVKQLSGGMKRRLMIAKALVHNPKLLLLDEPTAGVDISLRESLWVFVEELRKEGVSILLTTHYLEEAESLCDRVGIINRGKLEFLGKTKDVISQLSHRTVLLTLNRQLALHSDLLAEQNERQYRFVLPQKMTVGELMQQLEIPADAIADIRVQEGSLEDAFLKILQRPAEVAKGLA